MDNQHAPRIYNTKHNNKKIHSTHTNDITNFSKERKNICQKIKNK